LNAAFSAMIPTLAANPVEHVVDKPLVVVDWFGYHGWLVSNVTIMLVLSGIVTLLVLVPAAKNIMTGPNKTIDDYRAKGLLANSVEVVCLYLRDNLFKPALEEHCDAYTPFLWTMFWFIFICNMLGLIPLSDLTSLIGNLIGHPIGHHGHGIGGTATQSIWVTGAFALMSFAVINISGLTKNFVGYFKHLTGGAPWYVWPIMIPIEFLGIFIKPFALAVRLFANMTGGHLVIAVFLSFVGALIEHFGKAGGGAMSILPLLGCVGIYFLEIMVAVIQAFVFTFLTCLFLGQLIVHPHEVEHHHEHDHEGHDHAHGEGHAHAH
jgi:F-type H+-transporting ATPase subunit a